MEIAKELRSLLNEEFNEVKRLNDVFKELDHCVAIEAEFVDRLDRIAGINQLKARLVCEVDRTRQDEEICESSFDDGKLLSGALGFFTGCVGGKVLKRESPLSMGKCLFSKELEKKSHLGLS
jgi:hypothetical protein